MFNLSYMISTYLVFLYTYIHIRIHLSVSIQVYVYIYIVIMNDMYVHVRAILAHRGGKREGKKKILHLRNQIVRLSRTCAIPDHTYIVYIRK